MHVLRAEKGYPIIGQETDGSVTPHDLGMGRMASTKKWSIGSRSWSRSDTARSDRKQLVGLLPVDPTDLLPEGAQLVHAPDLTPPMPMLGHVSSSYRSDALGRTFALALVRGGHARIGETLYAPLVDRTVAAVVTSSVLFDPEGSRRDG
jgi:sarcosine oxidase subunit alpha